MSRTISLITALALGCGGSSDGSRDGGSGGSSCPTIANQCPAECGSIIAHPIDETATCIQTNTQTIGCWDSAGGVGGAIISCVKTPEGVRYVTPGGAEAQYLVESGDWLACEENWHATYQNCL